MRAAKGIEYRAAILAELNGVQYKVQPEHFFYLVTSRARRHLAVLSAPEEFSARASLWSTPLPTEESVS